MIGKYLRARRIKKDSANREAVLKLVVEFFGNAKKAELWMKANNPLLGGLSPEFMIRSGRSDRLLAFVQNCISENQR